MSTFIYMKILESTPGRYDRGIRILTLGKLDKIYDQLISKIKKDDLVMDLGCGTGALAIRAALSGAKVKAVDINPQMLEIAQERADSADLANPIEFSEMGVAELDQEQPKTYNVVLSGLCFSELTDYEITFALGEINRILGPEGTLIIADEVLPEKFIMKILYWVTRLPIFLISWLLTQTTTKAVKQLPEKVVASGFKIESVRFNKTRSFIELIAKKQIAK